MSVDFEDSGQQSVRVVSLWIAAAVEGLLWVRLFH